MKIKKEIYDLFNAGAASVFVTCTVKSTAPQDFVSIHQIVINKILSDNKIIYGILLKNKISIIENDDNFIEVKLCK